METLHWMQEIPERMKASYNVMFSHCQQTMPLSFVLLNNFVGFGGCGVVRHYLHLVLLYVSTDFLCTVASMECRRANAPVCDLWHAGQTACPKVRMYLDRICSTSIADHYVLNADLLE